MLAAAVAVAVRVGAAGLCRGTPPPGGDVEAVLAVQLGLCFGGCAGAASSGWHLLSLLLRLRLAVLPLLLCRGAPALLLLWARGFLVPSPLCDRSGSRSVLVVVPSSASVRAAVRLHGSSPAGLPVLSPPGAHVPPLLVAGR